MPEIEMLFSPLRLESGVSREDRGWRLVHSAVMTLAERGLLSGLAVRKPFPGRTAVQVDIIRNGLPFLGLGDSVWKDYDDSIVPDVYRVCGGHLAKDRATLNSWILAWAPGAESFMEIHGKCSMPGVMASLVGRGGDILEALKMGRK